MLREWSRWARLPASRTRLYRCVWRMCGAGLNLGQATAVIRHHHERGQLSLLFSEWGV